MNLHRYAAWVAGLPNNMTVRRAEIERENFKKMFPGVTGLELRDAEGEIVARIAR